MVFWATVLLAGCGKQQTRSLPLLTETYRKDDTKPFGSYVAYNHFKKLFNDRYVETTVVPFDETWTNIKEYSSNTQYSLYFLLARNLSMTSIEAIAMANFVKKGNDLFISADYFDMQLQAQLDFFLEREDEITKEIHGYMHAASVKTINRPGYPGENFKDNFIAVAYKYYYYPFLNYFDGYDSVHTRILGLNEEGRPNYIVVFIGNGRLYLHAAPRTFSNYFLLTENNYRYLEHVLSWLRFEPKNIYWDEYYKNQSFNRRKPASAGSDGRKNDFSSFNVIKNNPPLLWAFILAIFTLLMYIFVNIKRKQRVINEVRPNTNTTVTFTETVGRLYLQKKNNKNIAEKMITYFYEHIRNNYFLNTADVNSNFMNTLSRKSGVSIDATQHLFGTIDKINKSKNINDIELLQLNELIQKFYKNNAKS